MSHHWLYRVEKADIEDVYIKVTVFSDTAVLKEFEAKLEKLFKEVHKVFSVVSI